MTAEDRADRIEAEIKARGHIVIDNQEYFAAEWDLLLTRDQLRAYAIAQANRELAGPAEPPSDRLFGIQTKDGKLVRWKLGKVLTYAVLKQTFGDNDLFYQTVKNCMKWATRDWVATCGVAFQHLEALDDGVPAGATPPLFTVEGGTNGGNILAVAFFPNQPASERRVIVYPNFLTTTYDQIGILRHELGHVLGFRHEHIHPDAPALARRRESDMIGNVLITPHDLTPYDIHSVMHYPVPGIETKFTISTFDQQGSQILYGLPLNKVEDCE
jgi:Astacin (Peptidase family M12A)